MTLQGLGISMIAVQCRNETMKMNPITKKILSITLLMLLAIGAAAAEDADVSVTVNAPEYVSDTFEVTIDITEVSDIIGAQFDLTFDPDVIDIENLKSDVKPGMIGDTEMPIYGVERKDNGWIRIMVWQFDVVEEGGVSGSGYLTKIIFEVVGDPGDTIAIDIPEEFERMLSDVDADEIPANWFGANVTIGTAPSMPAETPTPTPDPSPTIVAASTPEPTATSIRTSSPNPDSPAFTARAQDAPAAAVPAASSEKDGLQDALTAHNFITIYSFIGLLAFIYSLTLFR